MLINSEAVTTADTRFIFISANKSTSMPDTTAVNGPTTTSARINSFTDLLMTALPDAPASASHNGAGCEHLLGTHISLLLMIVLYCTNLLIRDIDC